MYYHKLDNFKCLEVKLKKQSLLKSTTIVALMTFMSRIMGFVRDMVLAQMFGAQASMDAFYLAFRIPNFMRRLFAEGAFSQAFVPVLAEYQKTRPESDVRLFLARIAGNMSAVLTAVTLFGIIAAPLVIYIFAPGFGDDSIRHDLAVHMLRLTFPYLMLISLTAMAGAILNTYGYFGIPAFTPVLLNISMIAAAIYLSPKFSTPVIALAWGVLIAGIAQLLFQIPFLMKRQLLVKPQVVFSDDGVRKVLKLMVPALFGVSVAQVNLMVDTIFASFLQVSSVTWLYYTDRLTDFPLGVFGVAIATVILPHLSRNHAEKSNIDYSKALDWALRILLLIGIPAAFGLIFFAAPMIASFFAYGKFSLFDVLQTQKSLITLSIGLPAFMMVKVLASGFYAKQNIKTPVKVGVVAMVVNSVLCALLFIPMAHAGLTLASSISSYVNSGILLILLIRREIYLPRPGWGKFLIQLAFANGLLIIYLVMASGDLDYWMHLSRLSRIGSLLAHVLISFAIYIAAILISGIRINQFKGQFKSTEVSNAS